MPATPSATASAKSHPGRYQPADLLPHRGRMLLIDEIITIGEEFATTRSRVKQDWPLAGEDGVSPLVFIELAAQTAGIHNGRQLLEQQGEKADRLGWLVAIKHADFYGTPACGMELITTATNTLAYDLFREVHGQVFHDQQLLADIVVQLYQPSATSAP